MVPNSVMVAAVVAVSFSSTRRAAKPGQEANAEMSTPQPSSTPAAMQKKPTYARSVAHRALRYVSRCFMCTEYSKQLDYQWMLQTSSTMLVNPFASGAAVCWWRC